MNKKIIAFAILLCVLACTILVFVIQKDFNSYKISFSISNKDDALAFANNDSEVKNFIDYWASHGSEIIICEPYFYTDMNLWGVGFTPTNTYDLYIIIYFTPEGRIVYRGMGWGEEIGHKDIIENKLFGAWSGEISNLSCNKVALELVENGSVKINYRWFFTETENRTEITWANYFMLDFRTLWLFPIEERWNFTISDDGRYILNEDLLHLVLTKKEVNVIFTIYDGFDKHYNFTVYNVSLPLEESEAKIVFETITGIQPSLWNGTKKGYLCEITKMDYGWKIYYGLIEHGTHVMIYEQNRTIYMHG